MQDPSLLRLAVRFVPPQRVFQQEWANLSKNEAGNTFKDFAIELGLDSEQMSSCYESGKYLDEIINDYQEGIEYGTRGTPGFFIGTYSLYHAGSVGAP